MKRLDLEGLKAAIKVRLREQRARKHVVTLEVSTEERGHLLRTTPSRDDVEVVADEPRLGGKWRLTLRCKTEDVAAALHDAYHF